MLHPSTEVDCHCRRAEHFIEAGRSKKSIASQEHYQKDFRAWARAMFLASENIKWLVMSKWVWRPHSTQPDVFAHQGMHRTRLHPMRYNYTGTSHAWTFVQIYINIQFALLCGRVLWSQYMRNVRICSLFFYNSAVFSSFDNTKTSHRSRDDCLPRNGVKEDWISVSCQMKNRSLAWSSLKYV